MTEEKITPKKKSFGEIYLGNGFFLPCKASLYLMDFFWIISNFTGNEILR
jgi:hypothetical protein